jgi:SET domain-containing protein
MTSKEASKKLNKRVSPQFAAYRLRVRRSRIHGYGVYAAENIPPRRKVIEYSGQRLNVRQALARLRKICGSSGSKHLSIFRLNQYWRIDGAVGGSGAEFVNHCCDPNLKVRTISGHILFFSRQRIRKGQELTLDYRLHPKTFCVPCHCGSPNCRGTINRK